MNLTRSLLPFTFALIALFALAACGPAATQAAMPAAAAPLTLVCPEQSQAFVTALDQHVTTWGQAADSLLDGQDFQSAIPVLRQSSQDLPALIERLRGIQEEVRRMTRPPAPSQCVPPCWGRWTARSRYFTRGALNIRWTLRGCAEHNEWEGWLGRCLGGVSSRSQRDGRGRERACPPQARSGRLETGRRTVLRTADHAPPLPPASRF